MRLNEYRQVNYLDLTPAAITEIKDKIAKKHDREIFGIKITIKKMGCSGRAYQFAFAEEANLKPSDEMIERDGARVFIEPKDSLFLAGSQLDYHEKKTPAGLTLEASFKIKNKNENGRCGCGESFYV